MYLMFPGGFSVKLRGEGTLYQNLSRIYKKFEIGNTGASPNLFVNIVNDIPGNPDYTFGDLTKYYGVNSDYFYIKRGGTEIAVENDWNTLYCNSNGYHFLIIRLIEGLMRVFISESGHGMIHASGVLFEGRTILFPAWRHTGKTNTMLSFLRAGGKYLSDDRIIVDYNGNAHAYPTPIHLLYYNLNSFPELNSELGLKRFRSKLGHILETKTSGSSSGVLKICRMFNNKYIKPSRLTKVDDIFPNSQERGQFSVDDVFLLQTTTSTNTPCVTSISDKELCRNLRAINFHEWDKTLSEIDKSYEALPRPCKSAGFGYSNFSKLQEDIFTGFAQNIEGYRLKVPREDNWLEGQISTTILEAIRSVED